MISRSVTESPSPFAGFRDADVESFGAYRPAASPIIVFERCADYLAFPLVVGRLAEYYTTMETVGDSGTRTLNFLAQQILEALAVLERDDWVTARLILADLWQELELALSTAPAEAGPRGSAAASLDDEQLRRRLGELATVLRNRPQSESHEMAIRLEEILKR